MKSNVRDATFAEVTSWAVAAGGVLGLLNMACKSAIGGSLVFAVHTALFLACLHYGISDIAAILITLLAPYISLTIIARVAMAAVRYSESARR